MLVSLINLRYIQRAHYSASFHRPFSSSSHYLMLGLAYHFGFIIASVVIVTVYIVADLVGTVILVATIDTLIAVVVAND